MAEKKNTRLITLIILTIISAIFFIITIIPNSPIVSHNDCMNKQKAEKMYASKDLNAKNEFIDERNDQCKEMLKYAEKPKDTFSEIDTCNMVDSVMDASKQYIGLHKSDKTAVRNELLFLANNLKKYNYCPQYNDVATYINTEYNKVR